MLWDPILDASALDQAAAIRERRVSSEELVRLYLRRIEAHNRGLTAFVEVAPERALATARRKDAEVRRGSLPPFHGVPIGIKDLNLVRGFHARFGSRGLQWLWSPIDDKSARALRAGGFVVLGKLAASELGAMPVTEPDTHAPTRNPWNLGHTAGGSSGGSGSAVAAGLIPIAHGSDGAGSIRIPATFCHLFGLKPSRGLLPNQFGLKDPRILYTCGPITRTVGDAAAMLDIMTVGHIDSAAPPREAPFAELARRTVPRLRIKMATRAPFGTTHPEIEEVTKEVARALERAGHHVEPGEIFDGDVEEFLPLWQILVGATPVLLRHMQPITRWLAEPGRRLRRADVAALHDRIAHRAEQWFGDADVWLTPTVCVPAPRVGAWKHLPPAEAFREAAVLGAFTAPFNITGQPAVSIPAGVTTGGLPIGVQLGGRRFDEGTLLALAREVEEALPWRGRESPLVARDRG